MFALHDKTRRQVCLTIFLLLCLTPTVLVIGWCVAWRLPSHLRGETERLQQQLGLNVALQGLRHLRPGVILYEGLALADPETAQTLLRCGQVEATWTHVADDQGKRKPAVLLAVSQPEIEAAALDRLGQFLQEILQNQAGHEGVEIRITGGNAAIRSGQRSQTLSDFCGAIEAVQGRTQAWAVFHLAGAANRESLKSASCAIAKRRHPAASSSWIRAATPCPATSWPPAWPNSGRWGQRAAIVAIFGPREPLAAGPPTHPTVNALKLQYRPRTPRLHRKRPIPWCRVSRSGMSGQFVGKRGKPGKIS